MREDREYIRDKDVTAADVIKVEAMKFLLNTQKYQIIVQETIPEEEEAMTTGLTMTTTILIMINAHVICIMIEVMIVVLIVATSTVTAMICIMKIEEAGDELDRQVRTIIIILKDIRMNSRQM